MITITQQATFALSQGLSEEDRVLGRIFRINLHNGSTIELQKDSPAESDEQLEHDGYPVLAVPNEITNTFDSLSIDIAPSPDGDGVALVIKSGRAT